MSDEPVIACTLGLEELSAQARRWQALRRRAEIAQQLTPRGKEIRFRADDRVADELDRLVAVEHECCAWATWTVRRAEGELILAVTSAGAGVEAAQAMFSSATR